MPGPPVDVPCVYDIATKKAKRFFILDFASQLSDPAWGPTDASEGMLIIPWGLYNAFGNANANALDDLNNYISAHAP